MSVTQALWKEHMFKNLDGECFGIVGRQNEVIEFALSNGYDSVSVNFSDLVSRAAASGVDFAARYLVSAKKLSVGEGTYNLRLSGTDEEFNADIEGLNTVFEIVDAIRGVEGGGDHRVERITVFIQPYSDTLAYHENFELHRTRIAQAAEKLGEKGIKLGLGLQAAASKRADKEFEFIFNARTRDASQRHHQCERWNSSEHLGLARWRWCFGSTQ